MAEDGSCSLPVLCDVIDYVLIYTGVSGGSSHDKGGSMLSLCGIKSIAPGPFPGPGVNLFMLTMFTLLMVMAGADGSDKGATSMLEMNPEYGRLGVFVPAADLEGYHAATGAALVTVGRNMGPTALTSHTKRPRTPEPLPHCARHARCRVRAGSRR